MRMQLLKTLALLRKVNKRLRPEYSLLKRLRAGADFMLYVLQQWANDETSEEILRRTNDILGEFRDAIPLDVIEAINKVAFENEPAYRQRRTGLA